RLELSAVRKGDLVSLTSLGLRRGRESSRHELATFRIWKLETVPIRLRSGLLESQSQYPEREGLEPVRRGPDSRRTLRRLRRWLRSTPPAKVTHHQQCPGTHP